MNKKYICEAYLLFYSHVYDVNPLKKDAFVT